MSRATVCTSCAVRVDPLDVFPGGVCVECWAVSVEGRRMPTASEIVSMWEGEKDV